MAKISHQFQDQVFIHKSRLLGKKAAGYMHGQKGGWVYAYACMLDAASINVAPISVVPQPEHSCRDGTSFSMSEGALHLGPRQSGGTYPTMMMQ